MLNFQMLVVERTPYEYQEFEYERRILHSSMEISERMVQVECQKTYKDLKFSC